MRLYRYISEDKTAYQDLENKLINFVEKEGAELRSGIRVRDADGIPEQLIMEYEIENKGAIIIKISRNRKIYINNEQLNGAVSFLGFDEPSEYFIGLTKRFSQLYETQKEAHPKISQLIN